MAKGMKTIDLVEKLSTIHLVSFFIHQHRENKYDEAWGVTVRNELVRRKVLTWTDTGSVWDFAGLAKQDGWDFFLETLEDQGSVMFLADAKRYLTGKQTKKAGA